MYEYFPTFTRVWNGLMDCGIRLCNKGIAYCDRKIAEGKTQE